MSRGTAAGILLWLIVVIYCISQGGLDSIGGYEAPVSERSDTSQEMADTPCDEADQPGNEGTAGWRWCKGETGPLSWVPGLAPLWTPCPTEDSTGCYWDAAHRGDGRGRSFINWDS